MKATGISDSYFQEEDWVTWDEKRTEYALYEVAEAANLTQGEINVLLIYMFPPHSLPVSSDERARVLSKLEDTTVSSELLEGGNPMLSRSSTTWRTVKTSRTRRKDAEDYIQ